MEYLSLYALKKNDLAKACAVLTEAFAHDPFYSYILGEKDFSREAMASFHRYTLNYGLKFGRVWAPSVDLEGIAIWLPPGQTEMTALKTLRAGVMTLIRVNPLRIAERRSLFLRLARYGKYSAEMHKRHAPFPHWYLMVIGVADEHRGKGFAARLIRPVLHYLDSRGLPCYLETHNPANPGIYEHFGFKVVDVGRLPGTEKPHWAMLRMSETL